MGKAIVQTGKQEGEIFTKWMYSRLIVNNKNVLSAELGPTGSGKSYRDLRKAELWYEYYFKEKFPRENICFGVSTIMKKLAGGKLRRGEVLIFEEAGVNLGALDFQTKISKMFNYVLQSFRSMNIAIFFNLPYLSMLSSQARKLMHYSAESSGINYETGINKCRPFFHQVNQSSGKVYKKYPIVKVNHRTRKVKRFGYSMPSKYLADAYEAQKEKYLMGITNEYVLELDKQEEDKLKRLGRKDLTPAQREVIVLLKQGKTQTEMAKILGKAQPTIHAIIKAAKAAGYSVKDKQMGGACEVL